MSEKLVPFIRKNLHLILIATVLALLLINQIPLVEHAHWTNETLWSSRITSGQPLYPAEGSVFKDTPGGYCMIPYAPVYYVIWGLLDKIWGVSSSAGSAISLVCTLLVGLFVYLILKRISASKLIGAIGVVLFLTAITVTDWSIAPRPDNLALLLSLIGVYLVIKNKVYYSIPIFCLAIFTKQSYIVAPTAVALYLLWKDRKRGFIFIAGLVALLLSSLGIANYVTHGEFYRHVVVFPFLSGGSGVIKWSSVPNCLLTVFVLSPIAMSLGLGALIYNLIKRKIGLVEIWLIVALIEMTLTIGKPGSATNYALETTTVCCISGALLVNLALQKKESWKVKR